MTAWGKQARHTQKKVHSSPPTMRAAPSAAPAAVDSAAAAAVKRPDTAVEAAPGLVAEEAEAAGREPGLQWHTIKRDGGRVRHSTSRHA
jgi:hypothetical protein